MLLVFLIRQAVLAVVVLALVVVATIQSQPLTHRHRKNVCSGGSNNKNDTLTLELLVSLHIPLSSPIASHPHLHHHHIRI